MARLQNISLYFFLWFSVRFREITCKRSMLEKQKGSFVKTKGFFNFVSPSTKEQQRKLLVNLTLFSYMLFHFIFHIKLQRNGFLSIWSTHAEN